jgi:hypothetical protein
MGFTRFIDRYKKVFSGKIDALYSLITEEDPRGL